MTEFQQTLMTNLQDAELSIGFASGSGVGAVLLALVAIVFLLRARQFRLPSVISAWISKR